MAFTSSSLLPFTLEKAISLEIFSDSKPLRRYLDDVGDGTGTKLANGDYSVAKTFKIVPASTELFVVDELDIILSDGASMSIGVYGALLGALTNGYKALYKRASATRVDLFDGVTVKTNKHLLQLSAYEAAGASFTFDTDSYLVAKLNFANHPIVLDGEKSDSIQITLNDNFTGINEHYFLVKGTALTKASS